MEICRLCEGECTKRFENTVLKRHRVSYYQCNCCGSLQTQAPFWLSEAYTDPVSHFDPDYLDRGLRIADLVLAMWRILGLARDVPILDFGAGIGVTTRRLRDFNLNAFSYDNFTGNIFDADLAWKNDQTPCITVASEVFEHLPNPRKDLQEIFLLRPKILIAMTCLYRGQDRDWGYIGSEHGQHVFFYSADAINLIAVRFGYKLMLLGDLMIFHQDRLSAWQRYCLNTLLRSKLRIPRGVYALWWKSRQVVS